MAAPIILKAIQAIRKASKFKKALKALGKFAGRQVLRRTGIFGLYGTFAKFVGKNFTKSQIAKKVTTSLIKKNLLRALGPMNYMVDIFKKKEGLKYALKQFGWQRMTPMAIKKVWYLYQNYQSTYGTKNPILKQSKREIWKHLRYRNSEHTQEWKVDQIKGIMESEVPKKFKDELLNDWFRFMVKSPQSHNFNRTIYAWNPKTGQLLCSIRSGGGQRILHYYSFTEPDIDMIKKMVKTGNYGKMIYWKFYHTSK